VRTLKQHAVAVIYFHCRFYCKCFIFWLSGNVQDYEMDNCVAHGLIPTVSTQESVVGMYKAMKKATPEINKK